MKLLVCTQIVDRNHPILGFFHGWVLEFAKHFSEVHVICLQKGEFDFPLHVHVYSLGKEEGENKLRYLYRFYRYFGRIFFNVRPNYVFFHMGSVYNVLAAPFFLLRSFFGIKFYWWKTHGTLSLMSRLALCFVDAVYTAAEESFPLDTKKKRVVGHAIEGRGGALDFKKESKTTPPTLLFVGRVTPVKRVELVIETAEKLYARGIVCSVRIVGALADSAYEEKIKTRIANSPVASSITLVGPKTHDAMQDEYAQASLVLNPSETGGIDKVVLESMLLGVPAICLSSTYGTLIGRFGLTVETQTSDAYEDIAASLLTTEGAIETLAPKLHAEVVNHHMLDTLSKRIFTL
jgi:glycosyltransferase involved in cell wall biosynthesis